MVPFPSCPSHYEAASSSPVMWSVLNHCSKVGQASSTCQYFNFLRIKSTKYPSAEKRRRVRTLDRDVSQLIWMEVYRKRQITCDFLRFEEMVWNYYLTFSLFIYLILVDLFAGLLGYIWLDQKYPFYWNCSWLLNGRKAELQQTAPWKPVQLRISGVLAVGEQVRFHPHVHIPTHFHCPSYQRDGEGRWGGQRSRSPSTLVEETEEEKAWKSITQLFPGEISFLPPRKDDFQILILSKAWNKCWGEYVGSFEGQHCRQLGSEVFSIQN